MAAVAETPLLVAARPASAVVDARARMDALRVIGALAIVWLHAVRTPEMLRYGALGRWAVPLFTAAAVLFAFQSARRDPARRFAEYLRGRFSRLYVPFLGWSAIYLAFKLAKKILLPEQPNDFHLATFPYEGTFFHLWFVPFIFVATLAAFVLGRALPASQRFDRAALVAAVLAGCGTACLPIGPLLERGDYLGHVLAALPSVFFGLALALRPSRSATASARGDGSAWLVAAAVCVAALVLIGRNIPLETLGGLALILWAQARGGGAMAPWLARFAPWAMGIYLAHVLVIKVAEAVLTKLRIAPSAVCDAAVFLIAAAATMVLVAALDRWKPTRWLVG